MIPARHWLPIALAVAVVAGAGLVQLQQYLDTSLESYRSEVQELYLPSGDWVKRLSLGYHGLMACVYWTRAVQHYGRQHIAQGDYKLLYPLLDITTTLDPELILAYRFGAIFLTEKPPHGPGRADQAIALLEKGIKALPDYWRFWYDVGFVYYRGLKDYQRASEALSKGSQYPGAAPWMRLMAAKVLTEGGTRQNARELWLQLYNSTDDPTIRGSARHHLLGLRADDEIEFLEKIVTHYREKTGQNPATWRQLIAAGFIPGQPLDPTGHSYRLAADGRVLLQPDSPLLLTSQLGNRK